DAERVAPRVGRDVGQRLPLAMGVDEQVFLRAQAEHGHREKLAGALLAHEGHREVEAGTRQLHRVEEHAVEMRAPGVAAAGAQAQAAVLLAVERNQGTVAGWGLEVDSLGGLGHGSILGPLMRWRKRPGEAGLDRQQLRGAASTAAVIARNSGWRHRAPAPKR